MKPQTKILLICFLGSVFLSHANAEADKGTSTPSEGLPAKIHKIQEELPAWMQKADNRDQAAALMQKLRASVDARNFAEAEKTADSILQMMGGASTPTPAPTPNSAAGRAQSMLVLVTVLENNGSTKLAADPASGGTTTPYSHTNSKSLSISLVNTTREDLKVNVKVTFLAQEQGGNHELVSEKTMESERIIAVGKPNVFTTDEVSFTHTSPHRGAPGPGGGPQGGSGPQGGGGIQSLIPASGHIYAGYKVAVFRGGDVVGSATNIPGK